MVAISIYIWFRFEWQFAVGAVVALTHDVLLTAGIFALFQFEFDLSTVAALLTIVGYSVNDTVVVSDRIRENLRKFKKMELNELLNLSINETLSRTILTGMTALAVPMITFLPVFAKNVFHQNEMTYTLFLVCSGVGSITGALTVATLGNVPNKGRIALSMLVQIGRASCRERV